MFRIIASNSSNISAACEQAFRRDLAARHLRRGQPKDPGAQLAERENAVGIDGALFHERQEQGRCHVQNERN